MLGPEAACLSSLYSALLLLAAAGSLPFNDAQVSSVGVFSLKTFSYGACSWEQFPSPSFWVSTSLTCLGIESFRPGACWPGQRAPLGPHLPPEAAHCGQSSGLWCRGG